MAIAEYSWQNKTEEQIRHCIRWCQNQLQLRDWLVDLDLSDTPPVEMKDIEEEIHGTIQYAMTRRKALIWIDLEQVKADNDNPLTVVIHEMLHLMVKANVEGEDEDAVCILEPLIYRLYCKENRIKLAEERIGY